MATTTSQNIDLPFTGGLDQRSSPYTSITSGPLKLFVAQNGRFNRTGMLDRRPGNSIIATLCGNDQGSNTPDISYGGKVTSFRDEAILVYSGPSGASRPGGGSLGGASLGTYSPAQAMLMYKGDISEVGLSRSPLTTSVIGQNGYDVATGNGYTIYVWGQGVGAAGDIYATVVDNITNAEIFSSFKVTSVGTVAVLRVCYVAGGTGGKQFVIAYTTTANNLNVILCSATSPSFAAPVIVKTDYGVLTVLEISAMTDRWVVAYQTTAALPSTAISLYAFDTDPSVSQLATGTCSDVIAAATGTASMAIVGTTGEKVWIAYSRLTATTYTQRIAAYNPVTLAETLAPTTLSSGADANAHATIGRFSSTEAVCAFDFTTVTLANRGSRTTGYRVTTAGAITSGATLSRNTFWARMVSKLFVFNGRVYVWVVASGTNLTGVQYVPWTAVLIDLVLDDPSATNTSARPVAIDAPRFSNLTTSLSSVVAFTATTFLTVGSLLRNTTGRSSSTKLITSFTSASRYQACELGDTLFLSGGMTSFYDGQRVAEVGFVYYPTTVAATPVQSAGTGAIANGIYWYRAIYTAVDARGNVHRSSPSVPYSFTMTGGNNTLTHLIPSLSLTQRQTLVNAGYATPVGVELYRTTVNPTTSNAGLDLEYYRTSKESGTALNDPTVETITVVDTIADGTLATYPQLYTHGNVVSNVQPPGSVALISHKSRLFAIADDQRTVYYTKQYVEGESPSFADEFTLPFDDGSQLQALASLDANWIIFSKTRIYYVSGDGPNDTAGANDYSFPARVSSEVGCIDPRSICVTSLGIVFQSSIGIYLLTRGLELQYIGAPVADDVAICPVITSAVVHPTQPQILFTMTNAAGTSGIRLVYDYRINEWTKDLLVTDGFAGAIVSAASRLGTDYNWADRGGSLWAEDTTGTVFTDAGAWVTMSADLEWVNVAGVQGNQKTHRIKLLGYRYSPCDLTLSRAENYQNTYNQAKLFTNPGLAAFPTLPIVQVEIMAAIQKGESTRVRIVDAAPTGGAAIGSGQGISWMCVTIEVDVLSDTMVLAAGQRG